MTIEPPGGLKACILMIQYAFYMYWREMEWVGQSFAYKLGLHPSTLAHLSRINSNFKK
jgi:hypothetical protein